jgi:hypothetical protein
MHAYEMHTDEMNAYEIHARTRDACPREMHVCCRLTSGSLSSYRILGFVFQIFAQAECLPIHLLCLPVLALILQHCCQAVYAHQCEWMLFTQYRHTQPKLFRSDHGIRFVSEPLIRTPGRLRVICWLATCPATFPRGRPAAWRLGYAKPHPLPERYAPEDVRERREKIRQKRKIRDKC